MVQSLLEKWKETRCLWVGCCWGNQRNISSSRIYQRENT